MPPLEISGTVTRRSNGSLTITPAGPGAPVDHIDIHEGALSSPLMPAMGDDVTVTIAPAAVPAAGGATPASPGARPFPAGQTPYPVTP